MKKLAFLALLSVFLATPVWADEKGHAGAMITDLPIYSISIPPRTIFTEQRFYINARDGAPAMTIIYYFDIEGKSCGFEMKSPAGESLIQAMNCVRPL